MDPSQVQRTPAACASQFTLDHTPLGDDTSGTSGAYRQGFERAPHARRPDFSGSQSHRYLISASFRGVGLYVSCAALLG